MQQQQKSSHRLSCHRRGFFARNFHARNLWMHTASWCWLYSEGWVLFSLCGTCSDLQYERCYLEWHKIQSFNINRINMKLKTRLFTSASVARDHSWFVWIEFDWSHDRQYIRLMFRGSILKFWIYVLVLKINWN